MFRDFAIFLGTHLYLELTSTCAESFQKRFYFHFTHLAFTHTLRGLFFFSFSCFTFSALSLFLYLSAYNLFSFEMLYLMAFCQKGRLKDTHVSALESLFISSFSQSCKTGERLVWQVEVIIGYFFLKIGQNQIQVFIYIFRIFFLCLSYSRPVKSFTVGYSGRNVYRLFDAISPRLLLTSLMEFSKLTVILIRFFFLYLSFPLYIHTT